MRPRPRTIGTIAALLFAVATAFGSAATPRAGAAASTFHYREFSQGANIVFSPNCPFGSWLPSTDTLCDTYTVWYVRLGQAVDGGPLDRSSALFHAEVDHEVDLVHPDGSGYEVSFAYGISAVDGTYDATHLTSAHMDAVSIAMRDVDLATGLATYNGRVTTLGAFDWNSASGIYEYGNDGPAFGGGPRHSSTRCFTINQLAHQKDAVGYVSGSLDGTPLSAEFQDVQIPGLQPSDATGYIFDNWFHVDDVEHCF